MKEKWITAYIALGSNIGDREYNLRSAVEKLRIQNKIKVNSVSSLLNTAPVGYTDQPDFLNAVVKISTSLTPMELLQVCGQIEQELKRERIIHWGPRTIDLDILLYGDFVVKEENLTIPHPRMHEREFVLQPLDEIAPEVVHPIFGQTIRELLHNLQSAQR